MIVQMKRMTLVAHKADEADILQAIQATQSVEVLESGEDSAEQAALDKAEEKVQKLDDALKTLRPYGEKQGLLSAMPEARIADIAEQLPKALSFSDRLEEIARDLAATRSEIEKNETIIDSLRPWEHFPADMQTFQNVRGVKYFTGMIAASDVAKLEDIDACAEYQLFNEGVVRTCVVACPDEEAKSVASFLKSIDWTDYAFPKTGGKPADAVLRLTERNRELSSKKHDLEVALANEASGSAKMVESALDAATIERDRARAAAEIARTSATFQLEGWVPEDKIEAVEKAVRSVTDACYFSTREPEKGEVPPSVVENNKFATPFEQVTNLYSRPDPNGIDATPYMAPFYVLLFGLMLSDTGYGIVLALA